HFSANIPMATLETCVLDPACIPGCPTAQCAGVPATARLCAGTSLPSHHATSRENPAVPFPARYGHYRPSTDPVRAYAETSADLRACNLGCVTHSVRLEEISEGN